MIQHCNSRLISYSSHPPAQKLLYSITQQVKDNERIIGSLSASIINNHNLSSSRILQNSTLTTLKSKAITVGNTFIPNMQEMKHSVSLTFVYIVYALFLTQPPGPTFPSITFPFPISHALSKAPTPTTIPQNIPHNQQLTYRKYIIREKQSGHTPLNVNGLKGVSFLPQNLSVDEASYMQLQQMYWF